MRHDVFLHFPERFYEAMDANLSSAISGAASTVASLSEQVDTLTAENASLSTALAGADTSEDDADAAALSSAISTALAPAVSISTSTPPLAEGVDIVSVSAPAAGSVNPSSPQATGG